MAPELCAAVLAAIKQDQQDETAPTLAQLLEQNEEACLQALVPKLQAILGGDRDPALAEDEALEYVDAAELQLLLEQLA